LINVDQFHHQIDDFPWNLNDLMMKIAKFMDEFSTSSIISISGVDFHRKFITQCNSELKMKMMIHRSHFDELHSNLKIEVGIKLKFDFDLINSHR
jgi:hypothetical protein